MISKRIESLDYLRGIMAVSVMIYHYYMFSSINHESGILGKLGIYAVSTFYILSGLSLTLVYYDKMNNIKEVLAYMIKRVFRIFPLIWLATSITLLFEWFGNNVLPGFETILLNYTLLFGFFKIDAYIAIGAWSIGNEMVFYLLFPIFIFILKKFKNVIWIILSLFVLIAVYYAFFILNNSADLSVQWIEYINPLNQIYLFVIGITIALFFKVNSLNNKFISILGIIIFLGLIFSPSYNQSIDLVTNWERIYYSICFTLLALLFFVGVGNFDNIFGKIFQLLGEISYSIYLLHPLVAIPVVHFCTKYGIEKFDAYFYFSLPLTLISSYISYRFIENPMMRLGKILTNNMMIKKEL